MACRRQLVDGYNKESEGTKLESVDRVEMATLISPECFK